MKALLAPMFDKYDNGDADADSKDDDVDVEDG